MNAAGRGSLSLCVIEAVAASLSSSFQKERGVVKCRDGLREKERMEEGMEGGRGLFQGLEEGSLFFFFFYEGGG